MTYTAGKMQETAARKQAEAVVAVFVLACHEISTLLFRSRTRYNSTAIQISSLV